MVKLAGPMFSLDASGSIASTITFAKWRGRPYARQLVVPANPQSPLQVSIRSMMRFITRQWAGLGATPKGSWLTRADLTNISGFNAFTAENMRRWREFQSPGQTDPVPETGTEPVLTLDSATAGTRSVDLTLTVTTLNDVWGLVFFRGTATPLTTSVSTAIHVLEITGTGTLVYTDSNLDAGTYYYNARAFTKEGKLGAVETERSATVS